MTPDATEPPAAPAFAAAMTAHIVATATHPDGAVVPVAVTDLEESSS